MTVREYIHITGLSAHAAAKRLQRAGRSSSLNQEVDDTIRDILSAPAEASRRGRPRRQQLERAPSQRQTAFLVEEREAKTDNVADEKADIKRWSLSVSAVLSAISDVFLISGVVAHCVLVVQELILNAGQIGATAGVFVSLIYAASLVLSIMPKFYEQSFTLILVIFFLDMCSIYLHYVSFRQAIPSAFALGLSVIVGLCAFYCSYLFRSKHLVDDSDNA
jgi:uncharacterized membrane protein (UPF0136 family)